MEENQTYVVTLVDGLRLVAEVKPAGSFLPGVISCHILLLERELLLPTTSILTLAPCTAEEARLNAKALNGERKLQNLFGVQGVRLKVKYTPEKG